MTVDPDELDIDANQQHDRCAPGRELVAVESIAFPGVYLRMDGRAVASSIGAIGGVVNCQFGARTWERSHGAAAILKAFQR